MKLLDTLFLARMVEESEEGDDQYYLHREIMDHINTTFKHHKLGKDDTAFFVYGNGRSNFDAVTGKGSDLSNVVDKFCGIVVDSVTERFDARKVDAQDICVELGLEISSNEEYACGDIGIRIKLTAANVLCAGKPVVWELDEIPQGPDHTWGTYGKPTNVGKLLKKGKKCNSKRTRG